MSASLKITNESSLRHVSEFGTVFYAERADLSKGVYYQVCKLTEQHPNCAQQLQADFAEFGAWHASIILPELSYFSGYRNISYKIYETLEDLIVRNYTQIQKVFTEDKLAKQLADMLTYYPADKSMNIEFYAGFDHDDYVALITFCFDVENDIVQISFTTDDEDKGNLSTCVFTEEEIELVSDKITLIQEIVQKNFAQERFKATQWLLAGLTQE